MGIFKSLSNSLLVSGLILGLLLAIGMSDYFGLNSGLYTSVFGLHLIAFCIACYRAIKTICKAVIDSTWPKLPLFLLLGATLGIIIALGILPVTAGDALIHHIAVPKWWLQTGTIHYIDFHGWSNYPMLLNLAYAGIMRFAPVELCALYHGAYLIILAALIIQFLNTENSDPKISLLAGLMTLGLPMFLRLAAIPLVDLGLAAYSFLCLMWIVSPKQNSFKYLLAGLALGLALSIKYNAILAGFVITAVLWISLVRDKTDWRTSLKYLVVFICGALIVYAPWMIKNYAWTANPIYPLFNSVFGAKGAPSLGGLNPIEHRKLVYNETWIDFISLPIRMLVSGQDMKGKYFDGVLHPGLIFGFLGITLYRSKDWIRYFALFSVLYFLLATTLAVPRARYLSPMLGCWICLSSIGCYSLVAWLPEKWRAATIKTFLVVYFCYSGFYLNNLVKRKMLLPYIKGELSKEDYLKRSVPDYELISWINTELPETSKIYLLNTPNRFFYFERAVTTSGHDSSAGIVQELRKTKTAAEAATALSEQGITHIMANIPRTTAVMEAELAGENRLKWNEFQAKHMQALVQSGSTAIWELKPDE
ncbi:MAG: hypothetical protein R3A13_01680 [Bdellovibrionota bacterium]